ncbi:hypothetical protein ACHQM5_012864 [Ranunculus cassubicifolius]
MESMESQTIRAVVTDLKERCLAYKKRCDAHEKFCREQLDETKMKSSIVVKEWKALKEERKTLSCRITKMDLSNYFKMVQLDVNYRTEITCALSRCLDECLTLMTMEIGFNYELELVKKYQKDNDRTLLQIASIEMRMKTSKFITTE